MMLGTGKLLAAFVCASLVAGALPVLAAENITITQHLSFGSFILKDNKAAHTVTVTPAGNATFAPEIVPLVDPVNGIYQLEGFNPNADLSVLIDPPSVALVCSCGGPQLTLDNFDLQPATPHTDPAGAAVIYLGARLRTDGTQAPYHQGNFTGQISIIVNN